MTPTGTLATARVSALMCALFFVSCGSKNTVNPRLDAEMPRKILWAWERPEDLRFIDTNEYGVAFLAQTIFLESDRVLPKPRRQPLELAPKTYLIAVTRIETNKDGGKRPTFDEKMAQRTAKLIRMTLDLPDVKALQVDFDAVVSERAFYKSLMVELRAQMPPHTFLTMTALASWCTDVAWFHDFPVDDVVPMVFQMGADSENIKTYLRNNDWRDSRCTYSYGISVDEGKFEGLWPNRRIYYFKNSSWNAGDVSSVK